MTTEKVEAVLQEILHEQKETNILNAQLATYIKSLSEKLNTQEKRLDRFANLIEADNLKLSETIENHLSTIQKATEIRNTDVVHTKVYQLFPSFNIREYYQVYGNIFKWLALFGAAWMIIRLIRDLLEKQALL